MFIIASTARLLEGTIAEEEEEEDEKGGMGVGLMSVGAHFRALEAHYPKYYTHIYFNTPLGDRVVMGWFRVLGQGCPPREVCERQWCQ